jgi:tetraacyldisaccharide 4'-kinase
MFARLTRTAPGFWGRPPGLLADLLLPIGATWDAVGRVRRALARSYCVTVPVVCIGNLVAGGAGKTPVTLALSAWLRERGVPSHVVTRGYGGYFRGPVPVDLTSHDAVAVGDEALMLAARAPCWVARDRVAGARAAVAAGARAILLDDGFQDSAIDKTLALIVVDAEYRFGNGRVIPAGPLRENLRNGLARADAVVLLVAEGEASGIERLGAITELPVIGAVLAPVAGKRLAGERLLALAGIGRPEKFFATLRSLDAVVVDARAFPDHHQFRAAEIELLRRNASRSGARLITTRKDIVRLPLDLREGIEVLDVEVRWLDPAAVARLMAPVISAVGGNGRNPAD